MRDVPSKLQNTETAMSLVQDLDSNFHLYILFLNFDFVFHFDILLMQAVFRFAVEKISEEFSLF